MRIYSISIPGVLVQDSLGRVRFFEETFLLADTSMEVILGMPFLSLSNADFEFGAGELAWRIYTAAEALITARRVELIDKHEFAKAALDENPDIFVVHVAALEAPKSSGMVIHPSLPGIPGCRWHILEIFSILLRRAQGCENVLRFQQEC